MAYQINYAGDEPVPLRPKSGIWKAQVWVAGVLLLTLFLLNSFVPEAVQVLSDTFLPQEGTAAAVMAQTINDGGTFRDGLVAVGRGILESAGYGA